MSFYERCVVRYNSGDVSCRALWCNSARRRYMRQPISPPNYVTLYISRLVHMGADSYKGPIKDQSQATEGVGDFVYFTYFLYIDC